MVSTKFGIIAGMIALVVLVVSPSPAEEKDLPFALQVLDTEVGRIESDAAKVSQGLAETDAKTLATLLRKQRAELSRVEKSYRNVPDPSESDLSNSLATFFQYANDVRKLVQPAAVTTLGKSDSPHDCSNRCYRSCGYNSIGDLICYNKCVKCCNAGGCN